MDIIYNNNLLVHFHGPTLLQPAKLLKPLSLYIPIILTLKKPPNWVKFNYLPASCL